MYYHWWCTLIYEPLYFPFRSLTLSVCLLGALKMKLDLYRTNLIFLATIKDNCLEFSLLMNTYFIFLDSSVGLTMFFFKLFWKLQWFYLIFSFSKKPRKFQAFNLPDKIHLFFILIARIKIIRDCHLIKL